MTSIEAAGVSKHRFVRLLRDRDAIYIVGSGRINVAGLTEENIDRVCDGMARVL